MNKQYCLISCPIDTYSGYGGVARDFVKALYELKKDEWEIQIIPQRWGSTPWNYIKHHEKDWGFLNQLISKSGQISRQPDVWIQITVPNEFQPIGKFNIGVTAGIETNICHASWLDGCNRMNLNLVGSNFSKDVFVKSAFEERNQNGQPVRNVKLEKQMEVLFYGLDTNKYFYINEKELPNTELVNSLNEIEEDFCFLFVGHWLPGEIGEDRKNVGLTIKNFLESFKGYKNKPALILKTSSAGASVMDRESVLEKIDSIRSMFKEDNLPNIYLLHGELEDEEMNNLYNHPKVKAMINFTKGEGFGRPLLEFSVSKKPIICSGYSGQMDFLDSQFVLTVSGEIKPIHPSAVVENMLIPESAWFSPDESQMKASMKIMYEKYTSFLENAKRQAYRSKTEFSIEKMRDKLNDYLSVIPKKVQLKLPSLKKLGTMNSETKEKDLTLNKV